MVKCTDFYKMVSTLLQVSMTQSHIFIHTTTLSLHFYYLKPSNPHDTALVIYTEINKAPHEEHVNTMEQKWNNARITLQLISITATTSVNHYV